MNKQTNKQKKLHTPLYFNTSFSMIMSTIAQLQLHNKNIHNKIFTYLGFQELDDHYKHTKHQDSQKSEDPSDM